MPFDGALSVTFAEDGRSALVLRPLTYRGRYESFTIPAGFYTDFTTVPQILQGVLPRIGKWTLASVLHDSGCTARNQWYEDNRALRAGAMSPAEFAGLWPDGEPASAVDVDGLFRRVCRELGVDPVRRWLLWTGVRWAP